jgi:hypothetical protein
MNKNQQFSQSLDNLLFVKIFRTFRMAIQPTKLIIAFLAVAVVCLAGWVMDFSNTVVVTTDSQGRITDSELQVYMTVPEQLASYIESNRDSGARTGVFSTLWGYSAARFNCILKSLFAFDLPAVAANVADYFKAAGWAVRHHFVYSVIFFAIKLAVFSVAGGSLCRIAALQLAQGEKPGLSQSLRYGTKKFTSFLAAPLVPLGIIIFMGISLLLLGLLGNIPWVGELLLGFSMPLTLLAGALIAIVLIGAAAGFNLMFPAVAYDGSDCFDAVSRSFSYVYTRPWRMGFYSAVAAVYGAVCYIFVRFFAFLLLWSSRRFLQFGVWTAGGKEVNKLAAIWPQPNFINLLGSRVSAPAGWSQSAAAILVHLFLLVVIGLLVSFIISFYFSANTIIYAALRNRVDGTALEEIYTDSEQETTEVPAAAGPGSEETQPQQDRG